MKLMGRLFDEKELQKYIMHDGCEKGCGYIDERDLKYIQPVEAIPKADVIAILDKISTEIKDYFSITCDGNCDNCNRAVKNPCGESVDGTWVLYIIDKYKTEAEEAKAHPINENIAKGFEEFTKMMFRQGQAESKVEDGNDN